MVIILCFYLNMFTDTIPWHCLFMWPNKTKGTSRLLLRKLRFLYYVTEDLTSFPMIPNSYKLNEGIVLKIQVLQSVNFLLFSLYFTHCFTHYLRINLADKMSLLLYWVTYGPTHAIGIPEAWTPPHMKTPVHVKYIGFFHGLHSWYKHEVEPANWHYGLQRSNQF